MIPHRRGLSLLDLLVAVVLIGVLSTVLLTAASGLIQQSAKDEETFFGRLLLDELEHYSRAYTRAQGRSNWGSITANLPVSYQPPQKADGSVFASPYFAEWQQEISGCSYVDLLADTIFVPTAPMVTDIIRVEGQIIRGSNTIATRTWLVYRPRE